VVNLTIGIAKKYQMPVSVVKNYAIVIENDYAEIITVDISRDAADYYIANHIEPGDLVITQDNGLAAMVLAKKGRCLNQNGRVIDEANIDFVLDSRHHGRVARLQHQRGPRHKKRTNEDDVQYEKALKEMIDKDRRSHVY
jgi:uncharacterized protein YaiI (UPF0178 family)